MRRIALLAFVAFALFSGLNLLEMARSHESFDWVVFALDLLDTALLITAIGVVAVIAIEARELAHSRAGLAEKLERARAEGDRWRQTAQHYLAGLRAAINEQFLAWRLSDGEAEIAMGLLKGLSHKEIANLRPTSEATVRQQARVGLR